jgi:EpsI family protein
MLIGAACLAGGAAGLGLKPRRHVTLLQKGQTLSRLIPAVLPGWTSRDVSDFVAPKEPDSLAAQLYSQTVGRVYSRLSDGAALMMMLAYGDTQSDDLQLHRPEVCYPAFGFEIKRNVVLPLQIGAGVTVPSRALLAVAPQGRETVVYWSRLGEFMPLDRRQQQIARFRTALKGDVADGVLARFSVSESDGPAAVGLIEDFVPALLRATPRSARAVLIGRARAEALASAGV